jgi:hypothetical protein
MNVLQRRMFANGGPSDQPLQAYSQLIASYAEKGLSVDEALVELGDPTFPRAEVEKIYAGLGYSIDPSITDYQIIPQNPAGIVFGQPDLDRSLDLTDVGTAPESLQLDFDTPEVSPINIPKVVRTTTGDLGPNEIELDNGRRIDFSNDIDNINKGGYKSSYFLLFNSPDVKRGTNVDIALNNFVRANEPGLSRLGNLESIEERRGTAMGPMDFTQGGLGALNLVVDTLREGAEKIAPPLADFFAGKSAAEDVRDYFEGDYLSEGFFGRSGFSKEAVDDVFLRDFASEISELNNLPKTETILETEDGSKIDITPELSGVNALDVIDETKDLIAEDEKQREADRIAEETKQDEQLPDEDIKKIPEVTYTFDANLAKEIAETPSLFQTDAFRRFIRNVGTGLVKTGQIGSGLAAGSVLAAEEEKAIEDTKREALLEAIKEGDKGPDYKEAKSDVDVNTEISKNANLYNNTYNAILDLNYTIDQVKKNPDAVTGPRGAINRLYDQAAGAVGGKRKFEELSPASKVDLITRLLSNEQVKEILGESGRTISNVDREIVAQIFGTPGLLTTAGALETALVRSRERLIEKLGNYKNSITSNLDYFRQLNKTSALLQDSNNIDVFSKILTTDISNLRSIIRSPGSTDEYLQTNPLAIDLYPTT